ncbi:peptidoglycan DD-metalloendopeptidase family protein [Staphylococcus pseudintermedius]
MAEFNLGAEVSMDVDPLKASSQTLERELKNINKTLRSQRTEFKKNELSVEQLGQREKDLGRAIKAQEGLLQKRKKTLEEVKKEISKSNVVTEDQKRKLNSASRAVQQAENQLSTYNRELKETELAHKQVNRSTDQVKNSLGDLKQRAKLSEIAFKQGARSVENYQDHLTEMNYTITKSKANIDLLKRNLQEVSHAHGATSRQADKLRNDILKESVAMQIAQRRADELSDELDKVAKSHRKVALAATLMGAGFAGARNNADRIATTLRTVGEITQGVVGEIMATQFANLVPIIGSVVSVGAGLGGMLTALSGGAIALGGAFVIGIGGVKAFTGQATYALQMLEDGTLKITAETARYQKQLDSLKSQWEGLIAQNQAQIFNTMTNGINAAKFALGALNPFLTQTAQQIEKTSGKMLDWVKNSNNVKQALKILNTQGPGIFQNLLNATMNFVDGSVAMFNKLSPLYSWASKGFENMSLSFKKWANSVEGSKAINGFIEYTKVNLPIVGRIFGNVFGGIFSLFSAFSGHSHNVLLGIESVTEGFKKWSAELKNSNGFKEFVQYLEEKGPRVWQLIKNITGVLWGLIKGMAPVGAETLKLTNIITGWMSSMLQTHPIVGKLMGSVVAGTGAFLLFLKPILLVKGALGAMRTALLLATGAEKLLGKEGALAALGMKRQAIQTKISTVATKIWGAVTDTARGIANGFRYAVARLTTSQVLTTVKTKIATAATKAWTLVTKGAELATKGLGLALRFMTGPIGIVITVVGLLVAGIVHLWKTNANFRNAVINIWNSIKTAAVTIFTNMKNTIVTVFTAIKVIGIRIWTVVKNTVINLAKILVIGVVRYFNNLFNNTHNIFTSLKNWLSKTWSNIKNSVSNFARNLANSVRNTFNNLAKNTRNIFSNLKKWLSNTWSNIKNTVSRYASQLWSNVRKTFTNLYNRTRSIFTNAKKTIVNIWQSIKRSVTGLAAGLWSSVRRTFNNMAGGLKSIIGKIKGHITGMVDAVKRGLNKLISGVNWVADKIGMKAIPKFKFHTGTTSTHTQNIVTNGKINRDTFATVGDRGRGNGPGGFRNEMIRYPNGKMALTPNRDTTAFLPKGSSVYNGAQTHSVLSNMGRLPKFSTGTMFDLLSDKKKPHAHKHGDDMPGDVIAPKAGGGSPQALLGQVVNSGKAYVSKALGAVAKGKDWLSKTVGDVLDWIDKPGKLLDKILDGFGVNFDFLKGAEIPFNMMTAMFKKLKQATIDLFTGWLQDSGGEGGWVDISKGINFPFSPNGRAPGYPFPYPHMGVDLNYVYDKLYSTHSGIATGKSGYNGGFGNSMWIKSGIYEIIYGHMSKLAWTGSKKVHPGSYLGVSGNTGMSSGPHLHYEMRKNGTPIDPMPFLKSQTKGKGGGRKSPSAWRSTIVKAAKRMGVNPSNRQINGIIAQIQRESGGDAGITQSTAVRDINAITGNLAQGLLQYVPSTFRNFAVRGHTNIKSGYDQLLAFFNNSNWANDIQYGRSGWGPRGRRRFAGGTNRAPKGLSTVFEEGGEILNLRGGEQIIPNDVSIAAFESAIKSDLFNRTQSAVYEAISRFADGLREREEVESTKDKYLIQKQQEEIDVLREQTTVLKTLVNQFSDLLVDTGVIKNKPTGITRDEYDKEHNRAQDKRERREQKSNMYRGGAFA